VTYTGRLFGVHTENQSLANLSKSTIENALRLGRSDCGFSKACILECELVVYSDAVSATSRISSIG
jgi:hypothetical protein